MNFKSSLRGLEISKLCKFYADIFTFSKAKIFSIVGLWSKFLTLQKVKRTSKMHRLLITKTLTTLLVIFGTISLFSKTIYVRYDVACMDRLEYRHNGNTAGNGLISYSLKANDAERIVMEIGVESIKQVKRLPRGTKTCGKLKVDELLANSINSGKDKVFIVRKVGKYYIVSPVHLATYMKDSPKTFALRGNQFDMSYAADDIGVMENNLARRGSPTKVYFIGSQKHSCSDAYMLKRIPEETCKPYTDLTFLPGLGILEEKTGVNQAEAEGNILRLVKVNNLPLAEYIDRKCNGGVTLVETQQPAPAEEATPRFQPSTRNKPIVKETTPEQEEPTSFEVVFPADLQAPASEYRPAGSELIYEYDQPQKPLEAFRPKGANCKELSYPGVHIVQNSQTLYSISRQYNVTVNQLRDWNQMGNEDLIKPCASLYVLPPAKIAANTGTADSPLSKGNNNEIFIAKGNGNAEVIFRNTAPANTTTANNSPANPSSNVNTTPNTEIKPDAVYANAAKQSEILFPKSGNTPTEFGTTTAAINTTDGCNKLRYDGVHIVQKGETLYSIATKNGLTVEQVQTWNKLDDNAKITPCMSLYTKTPAAVIAAANTPNGNPRDETYTIPNSEISTGYTNAPTNTQVPTNNTVAKGGTNGQVLNNTNIGNGAATIGATDKMWNSGIEYHVVQKGETLVSLAKMYGFTLERFRDINGLGDANIIRIGQVLRTGNCLCPANGVGPTTPTGLTTKDGNNTGTIASGNETAVTNTSPPTRGQNAGNTNTNIQHSTEYVSVPVPYDYETENVLNQAKRGKGNISYRNGRKVHTVQDNETMATIANKYNLPIELLRKLNKMEAGEIVIPDMKIYLE